MEKGKHDEAIRNGKKCIDIAKETGNKHVEMYACLVIGKSHLDLEQYDDAIQYARMCLDIVNETNAKDEEIKAYLLLGEAHSYLSKHEDALSYFNVVLNIQEEIGNKNEMSFTYFAIGATYFYLKKQDDAVLYYKKCIDIANETGNKGSGMYACLLIWKTHYDLQQYDDALQYARMCLDMTKETGDKQIENIEMHACFSIAQAHQALNQYDDAVIYYKKCIDLAKEFGDKESEMKLRSRLVDIHRLLNQNEEAILHAEKVLEIAEKIGDKYAEKDAYFVLSNSHRSLNQMEEARRCSDKYNAIAEETGDTFRQLIGSVMMMQKISPLNVRDLVNKFLNETKNKWSFFEFSSILDVNNDPSVAFMNGIQDFLVTMIPDPNTWELALMSAVNIMDILQISLQLLDRFDECMKNEALTDQEKALISGGTERLRQLQTKYENKIPTGRLEWLLYTQDALHIYLFIYGTDALNLIDGQAACHSCIGMTHYLLEQNTNAEESLRESITCFESVFDRLNVDESKISIVDRYTNTYQLLSKVLVEEDEKEEALLVLERCRARALKDVLVLKYGMKRVDEDEGHIQLTDIKSLVSTNKFSILFYSVCFGDLHTCFIEDGKELDLASQLLEGRDHDGLEKYVKKAFDEMEVSQVDKCKNVIQDTETNEAKETSFSSPSGVDFDSRGEPSESNDESSLTSALEVLSHKLLDKISIKQDEIVIVPDGSLFQVPFAALRDPHTGRYLSEDKKIRLAPSLTTLKLLSECPVDKFHMKIGALVIGDPLVGKVMFDGEERDMAPLESADAEARVIAFRLGVTPLIGQEATKPAVIGKLQQGVSVVHIAAHGILSKATIALAPSPEIRATGKIPDEEDYMLTMADVQKAQVRAQLVVLSCCYSGRGEVRAEGVVGMCRAFLASGARAVVASLWAVDDDATLDFMNYFYIHLKSGKSASTSLQLAMNEIRQNEKFSEPKYWAPFFLMGDDVTI